MRAAVGALLALAAVGVWALACAEEEAPLRYAAPAQPRAALLLEPPQVAVGAVADLELAVVTPPGGSVRPVELPDRIPGFWVVAREGPETRKEPSRWVHRSVLRLRAVEVGRFEFPGGSVEVETAEGGAERIAYDPLPLEVVSTLPAHLAQGTPYGVRRLPLRDALSGGGAVAFAAGALLATASLGLLLLARRRLAARPSPVAPAGDPPAPPWVRARERLAAARAEQQRDPRRALDLAAATLRGYAVARFGGDAHVRTTEELRAAQPPFTMTTRWSRFTALLAELDAARFPATPPDAARVRELIAASADFVEESAPREPSA